MPQDAMLRKSGRMCARRSNQLAPPQPGEGDLDRAFGKTGFFRDHPQTGADRLPPVPLRCAVKMEVNQKSGRLAVVADQIPHQDIENIIVDWDRLTEARHVRDYSLYR